MFERKTCRNCGQSINNDWQFCPKCGKKTREESRHQFGIFGNIDKEFERIDKEFEGVNRLFSFSPFKIQRLKMKPSPESRGGGISIVVRSGTGMEPIVQVRTTGDYKKVEPEIKKRLGVKQPETTPRERKVPKVTEEPETEVQNIGQRKVITIKIPDVKNEDDVEIKRLGQSIEVKAFAGDKAYFKLIPVAEEAQIRNSFSKGILRIEIER